MYTFAILQPRQDHRLGSEGGQAAISHEFFQEMDWDKLERKLLKVSHTVVNTTRPGGRTMVAGELSVVNSLDQTLSGTVIQFYTCSNRASCS